MSTGTGFARLQKRPALTLALCVALPCGAWGAQAPQRVGVGVSAITYDPGGEDTYWGPWASAAWVVGPDAVVRGVVSYWPRLYYFAPDETGWSVTADLVLIPFAANRSGPAFIFGFGYFADSRDTPAATSPSGLTHVFGLGVQAVLPWRLVWGAEGLIRREARAVNAELRSSVSLDLRRRSTSAFAGRSTGDVTLMARSLLPGGGPYDAREPAYGLRALSGCDPCFRPFVMFEVWHVKSVGSRATAFDTRMFPATMGLTRLLFTTSDWRLNATIGGQFVVAPEGLDQGWNPGITAGLEVTRPLAQHVYLAANAALTRVGWHTSGAQTMLFLGLGLGVNR